MDMWLGKLINGGGHGKKIKIFLLFTWHLCFAQLLSHLSLFLLFITEEVIN